MRPSGNDARDWFVMLLLALVWTAATVFLFMVCIPHHEHAVAIFTIWAGMLATMIGAYHWLLVRDAKLPDAVTDADKAGHE